MKTITVPDPTNPKKSITLTQVSEPKDIDNENTVREIQAIMRARRKAKSNKNS